jgi:dihydrodipicolinate synthase/N-acetylneuraminate lyase
VIRSDAAGPITLTFPDTPRLGFNCAVVQAGAGAVTVIAGGGATMNNRQSFTKTAGQWGTIGVLAIAPDTYVLTGDGA